LKKFSTQAGLPGIELVCVAGGIECAHIARRPNVRFIPTVPVDDLPALYSASLGAVTATLLEGFCLPLIEAMACRTPVLATNIGPIPEVCGEHALLVDPTLNRLSDGMRSLVLDAALRSPEKLTAAEAWAGRFSWNLTASATANTFKSILQGIQGSSADPNAEDK
jgi:glycosyltransferase involved in cell wall biosynthesis